MSKPASAGRLLRPEVPLNREESQIAVLLDPQKDIAMGERDIRLEDWLHDKFQTLSDFEQLDSLVTGVEAQKALLETQLEEATSKLAESKKISEDHTVLILEQTQEFRRQHEDANMRLMIVTGANTPDEAIKRLQGPMEKLRRVELAKDYIDLLKDVDDLATEARGHLPDNPKDALIPYTHLKQLAINVRQLHAGAEGAGTHLVEHIETASTQLWASMTKIMSDDFQAVLDKAKWPIEANPPTRQWMDSFEKLLDLQYPELIDAKEPLILLPLAVLAKPFVQQFKYNFYGDKPTSHPHNLGDHIFPWFLGTITKWEPFLRDSVATIQAAHFRGTVLGGVSLYVDAVSALITALLPVLREKIDNVMVTLFRDPRLLSKFINQVLTFDDSLRSTFSYDGGNLEYGWKGLTWTIMDTWFEKWLDVEKDFALQRYQEIVNSQESGRIDFDSMSAAQAKPTFGATQVVDLMLSVKDTYYRLRRFSHKMRFVIEIQLELLDQYQGRLSDSLDAYQTITSPLARTLHGVTREQRAELEGLGGLESLCKVYGSSEHVLEALKELSNQEFFIDLWEELQRRAEVIDTDGNLVGNLRYSLVKEATSSAVGSSNDGGLWDETIGGYTRIRDRAAKLLLQALNYSYPALLKQYLQKAQWMTVGEEDDPALSISPELDQPLRTLRGRLSFLGRALGNSECRRICRQAFSDLEELLWSEVLLKQDFTSLGSAQFKQDILAIEDMAHAYFSSSTIVVMHRLMEAVELLSLPVHNKHGPPLKDAVSAVFGTPDELSALIETFQFTMITASDAKLILQRRREATE